MNDKFLTKEIKLKKVKQLHKNLFEKKRDKDNEYFKERLLNQKAFINPKMMDKNYSIEHKKVLMKLSTIISTGTTARTVSSVSDNDSNNSKKQIVVICTRETWIKSKNPHYI